MTHIHKLYDELNKVHFNGALPDSHGNVMSIRLSSRMTTSNGLCTRKKGPGNLYKIEITLKERLIHDQHQLRCTLAHEMIHALAYKLNMETGDEGYLDKKRVRGKEFTNRGHGAFFHEWMNKLNRAEPSLGISVYSNLERQADLPKPIRILLYKWQKRAVSGRLFSGKYAIKAPNVDERNIRKTIQSLLEITGVNITEYTVLETKSKFAEHFNSLKKSGEFPARYRIKRIVERDILNEMISHGSSKVICKSPTYEKRLSPEQKNQERVRSILSDLSFPIMYSHALECLELDFQKSGLSGMSKEGLQSLCHKEWLLRSKKCTSGHLASKQEFIDLVKWSYLQLENKSKGIEDTIGISTILYGLGAVPNNEIFHSVEIICKKELSHINQKTSDLLAQIISQSVAKTIDGKNNIAKRYLVADCGLPKVKFRARAKMIGRCLGDSKFSENFDSLADAVWESASLKELLASSQLKNDIKVICSEIISARKEVRVEMTATAVTELAKDYSHRFDQHSMSIEILKAVAKEQPSLKLVSRHAIKSLQSELTKYPDPISKIESDQPEQFALF